MKKIFSILFSMAIIASCGQKTIITEQKFPLTVDYSKTVEQVVSEGYYHEVESNLEYKFVTSDTLFNIIVEQEAILLNFDKKNYPADNLSLEEIKSDMKSRGFRPATAKELYTFGKVHPHVQVGVEIIGIGSQSLDGCFPVLGMLDGGRGAKTEKARNDYSWNFENKTFFLAFKE